MKGYDLELFIRKKKRGCTMLFDEKIYIAKSGEKPIYLLPKMANRHGLIAGATGTGKTITLKVLAESFSDMGVPVFLADVKGDLAGMCNPGVDSADMKERINKFGIGDKGFKYHSYPCTYWDIFGQKGIPLRTTISEMGPTLLARLLELTPTQEDVLNVVFKIADDEELLLIDTKDLRSMLAYIGENSAEYSAAYGNLSKASLNVITRGIVALESQGAEQFFGEPALNIHDWLRTDYNGKGMINILDSESLINNPKMYATFMLWMLSELFETMPEVGDAARPKMVFFFDEAHLLFKDAPKALLQKIEQVIKLIRSKGIGVYFITQSPKDIPDGVLAQLGNKIQHALRAYTPSDQKGLKAAADSFRINPAFKTIDVLSELGVGEALVSMLDEAGIPTIVERAKILPPQSQMGPIDDSQRASEIRDNYLNSKYSDYFDRDSAYEFLQRKSIADAEAAQEERERIAAEKQAEKDRIAEEKAAERARIAQEKADERARIAEEKAAEKERLAAEKAAEKQAAAKAKRTKSLVSGVAKSATGSIGRELGKDIGKSIGGSKGKTIGGNIGASLGRGIIGTFLGF